MATRSKQKPIRHRKEYATYHFVISDWEMSYSLGIDTDRRWSRGPYNEHCHLEINGKFISPKKVEGREAQLYLIGDRHIQESCLRDVEFEPKAIGGLTSRGARTEFHCGLPADATWNLCSLIEAGHVRVVELHGEALYRGTASISWINFSRSYDPDDLDMS